MGNSNRSLRDAGPAGPGPAAEGGAGPQPQSSRRLLFGGSVRAPKGTSGSLFKQVDAVRPVLPEKQGSTSTTGSQVFVSEDGARRVKQKDAKAVFIKALGKSKMLGQTSLRLREHLFDHAAVPVFVSAGDILFEQGTNGHLLLVLVKGKYKSSTRDAQERLKSRTIKQERAVAEYSVLMNSPHPYTLEAVTDGMILAVHRVQYQSSMVLLAHRERAGKKKRTAGPEGENIRMDDNKASDLDLGAIPLFAQLNKWQLAKVKQSLQELSFGNNERLVASKQIVPGLFIIKAGQVALRAPRQKKPVEQKSVESKGSMVNLKKTEVQTVFSEAEHDEIEWLTRGDYFGEAALISNEAELGVDVFCSSPEGVVVQVLRREDWKRIVEEEGEGDRFLESIRVLHLTRLIDRNPVFSTADDSQIASLVAGVQIIDFEAGARIMEAGAPVAQEPGMYLVTQGAVRLVPMRSLAVTQSQFEIAKRVQMLRENSHIIQSRRAMQMASHQSLARSTGNLQPDTQAKDGKAIERGSSVLGLSPSLLGRNVAEVTFSHLDLRGEEREAPSEPAQNPGQKTFSALNLTTSMDHEALFVSLGVSERDYVVLLSGELFGEEGISVEPSKRNARASVFAVGKVTLAFIPLSLLDQLGLTESVRNTALEEESAREEDFSNLTETEASELTTILANAQKISKSYLNSELLKVLEVQMQHRSLSKSNQRPERTASSSIVQLTAKRLWRLKGLHQTPVVDVAMTAHDPSCQLLVVKDVDVCEANKQGMGPYVLREQLLLAQISSNFVTNMVSSWEEPERLYLATEPALAGDLERMLARTRLNPGGTEGSPKQGELGGFDIDVLVFISACCVLGLKHLYEHQVLHRDIKPGNIVMDHFGYCKLVDFGIAKRLPAGSSRTYTLCGSPKYMSPELVNLVFRGNGEPYTNAVDWWALGMTLYEIATGKLPYADAINARYSAEQINKEALLQVDGYNRDVLAAMNASEKLNHKYSPYESHSWFKTFQRASAPEFREFGVFLAKLLEPDANARLGSVTSKRGPREALSQPVFKTVQFDRLAKKQVLAPFIPRSFVVEMENLKERVAGDATKHKIVTMARYQEDKKNRVDGRHHNPNRPTLKRANAGPHRRVVVENRVRADLEDPSSEKMADALESTDQARKQQIMAGQQHIRRVAFKQGLALEELDASGNGRNLRSLVIMQRATVLETLQVLVQAGGSARTRRNLAAIRIQTFWRSRNAKYLLTRTRNAAIIVQKFVRAARRKRQLRLEAEKAAATEADKVGTIKVEESHPGKAETAANGAQEVGIAGASVSKQPTGSELPQSGSPEVEAAVTSEPSKSDAVAAAESELEKASEAMETEAAPQTESAPTASNE